MGTARSTWVKLSNRIAKLHKTVPDQWKKRMPRGARLIVNSIEANQPPFKGMFVIGKAYPMKSGYGIDITAKPKHAGTIAKKQWGSKGGEWTTDPKIGRYPIYYESWEERERVLYELLAAEKEWIAGGRKGPSKAVSKAALRKLMREGIVIKYGEIPGTRITTRVPPQDPTRFIEKSVDEALPDLYELFALPIRRVFKGIT